MRTDRHAQPPMTLRSRRMMRAVSAGDEAKSILGIPDDRIIAFSCRLGYPISEPARYLRVRREVRDFTHHNRFGG